MSIISYYAPGIPVAEWARIREEATEYEDGEEFWLWDVEDDRFAWIRNPEPALSIGVLVGL